MLSDLFFHRQPFEMFQQFLHFRGIDLQVNCQSETFELMISEQIDDELSDVIEQEYNRLFEINPHLMDQGADDDKEYSMAGITLNLQDGSQSLANIRPLLINKVLSVLTRDGFNEMVQAIAGSVENPDDRNFCQRVREASR